MDSNKSSVVQSPAARTSAVRRSFAFAEEDCRERERSESRSPLLPMDPKQRRKTAHAVTPLLEGGGGRRRRTFIMKGLEEVGKRRVNGKRMIKWDD